MSSTSERENLMGEQSTESVVLPINLPYLLKRLSQVDFNLLVKSVDEEAVRRAYRPIPPIMGMTKKALPR